MSAMKFHVGDRVEDKKTHERGRVTFVYSTLELRDEFIAVLFDGHDEALAVPADSVRKVSTRQRSGQALSLHRNDKMGPALAMSAAS
jgi:hypothetical protein